MPSQHPRVSVVMPAFNREHLIGEAVESVLAQTYPDMELIVVDDGSTDGTGKAVERFGPKVRYIRTAHLGLSGARNIGIREARGEFLCYCDSDDIQLPYRVATQVLLLDRFREAALVSTDLKTYVGGRVLSESHLRRAWLGPHSGPLDVELRNGFGAGRSCAELDVRVPDQLRSSLVYEGWAVPLLMRVNLAWGCSQMARVSAVRAVGGHRVGCEPYEDWYLACQLAKSYPLVHLDAPLLLYRLHPGQQVGKPRTNTAGYLAVVESVWHEDPRVYSGNRRFIDRLLGSAFVMRGEVEARDESWARAAYNFRQAIRWNPRIKRAYLNWLVATVRRRVPSRPGGPLDRVLQRCLSPEARRRIPESS